MSISRRIRFSLENSSIIRKVADEVFRLRQQGCHEVMDFSIGNPVLEPPLFFQKALLDYIQNPKEGRHRYMPNNGYVHTRQKVAEQVALEYGVAVEEKHVTLQVGAAGGINVFLKSILDEGDEVIFFSPYFVEYSFYIENHGGKSVVLPTDENFLPDLERLEQSIHSRTKAILINSPNNPTGVVYSEDFLKKLIALVDAKNKEHGIEIYIINDTPYRRLYFEGKQAPEVFPFYRFGVMISSFSKDLGLPGERIGLIVLSPLEENTQELLQAMAFSSRVLGFVNAPALMQNLLPELLKETIDIGIYKKKKDCLYHALIKMGFECVEPSGAFYLFPRVPGKNEESFYQKLKERKVFVVPGFGFGAPGFFRISYCTTDETIERSLPHFQAVIEEIV